jgi:hypothetical protein
MHIWNHMWATIIYTYIHGACITELTIVIKQILYMHGDQRKRYEVEKKNCICACVLHWRCAPQQQLEQQRQRKRGRKAVTKARPWLSSSTTNNTETSWWRGRRYDLVVKEENCYATDWRHAWEGRHGVQYIGRDQCTTMRLTEYIDKLVRTRKVA